MKHNRYGISLIVWYVVVLFHAVATSAGAATDAVPLVTTPSASTASVHNVTPQLVVALLDAGLDKRQASRLIVRTSERSGTDMTDDEKEHLAQKYAMPIQEIDEAVYLAASYRIHPETVLVLKKFGYDWAEVERHIVVWVRAAALIDLRRDSDESVSLLADLARIFDVEASVLKRWAESGAERDDILNTLYFTRIMRPSNEDLHSDTFWIEQKQRIAAFSHRLQLDHSRFHLNMIERKQAMGMEIMHPDPIINDPSLGYNTATYKPFTPYMQWHTGLHNEAVHPVTGTLIVTHTDLILPGPDGFNLELSRVYNSDTARVYDQETAHTDPEYAMDGSIEYIGSYTDEYGEFWECFHEILPHTAHFTGARYEWFRFCENQNTGEWRWEEGIDQDPGWPVTTFNYTVARTRLFHDRYNLGVGWSYGFPMLEMVASEEHGKRYVSDIYLHTGDGRIFQADEPGRGNGLRHYPQVDMVLDTDDTYNNGQKQSAYALRLMSGVTYYFGTTGEILGLTDRHGHTINFTYYTEREFEGKLHRIDDAAGRTVEFVYSTRPEHTIVDVYVLENEGVEANHAVRYIVLATEQSAHLVSVQMGDIEATVYEYEEVETEFRYAYNAADGGNTASNVYVALTRISTPAVRHNAERDITEYIWERTLPRKRWISGNVVHPRAPAHDDNYQQFIRVRQRDSTASSMGDVVDRVSYRAWNEEDGVLITERTSRFSCGARKYEYAFNADYSLREKTIKWLEDGGPQDDHGGVWTFDWPYCE